MFTIETDASNKGLGAVLMQEGRPVAFLSQTLSDRAQTKSVYERELMAIVMAVQKWRHYFLGRHFIILTDQKSLKFLTERRVMGEEYFRWTSKLMGLDFEIQYRLGKENGVADALSRKMTFSALSSVHFEQIKDWETEIHLDPKLQGIIHDLIQDINSHPGYKFQNQKLFYKGRLVLPKGSSRIPLLLQEFHNSAVGGHSALYGRDPPHLLKGATIPSTVEEINVMINDRDQMLHDLKGNLAKAQNQMKKYADRSRRSIPLNIGTVAFELALPPESKIHPVFHVSLLKKALSPLANPQPLPPMLSEELELQVTLAAVKVVRNTAAGLSSVARVCAGVIAASIDYIGGEVVNGKNTGYGLPADIWSLGCTVLEMLTGENPYSPLESMQALFRIGRGEPPHVPDSLSRDARDFILQCLKVDPDERPSAAQLLNHTFVQRPLHSQSSGSASPYIRRG
ncbi:Mitogen-activated protein kinase kinase kinase 1 isoform C [Glycine soja]|uniref:Mitogen-activated protein kinase kinase kinase 1 isoform A n=1 Tax=Glycine soja TaxID=3848 RepID=A0A445H6X9_GLYSO|nr:Mitogen-activated protein kinase kinase kinase 1 isoform A [Glycine soja]RZB69358.1 Mitogen-activated protein kinase kinase kinase 1 isoform B [Glycine soja]RZB69359.1 Mitogen-activated protein kinase kinase kinase 1 isoform C [Glycine soja]